MTYRLSRENVDRLVDPRGLVGLIERVLVEAPKPPRRVSLEYEGSWFGVMPAYGPGYYSVKIVGVYPENPQRGLPLVRGLLLLVDSKSGDVLLEADAGPATGWRTAAATVVALKLMGYGGGVLGVIGAGVQADYHVRVIRNTLGFDKLLVYDIIEAKAKSLAVRYGGSAADLRKLLESSDAIVAATTSREPVVMGRMVRSGALIASIGAPKPVRELDEEVVVRSRCLLVDSVEGVKAESEEWMPAAQLVELAEALRGVKCEWGDVRVYKSVGYSLLDLAVALHLYDMAKRVG
ncbi:MAG: ornithine cyclodeaminase family protein [Thermoprotei archaeon]|nr:ornithine cyclodeaminase family protein [Thermoprotei archaeon]